MERADLLMLDAALRLHAALGILENVTKPDLTLAWSNVAISARLSMYRGLMELGWTPPADVLEKMELDEELLRMTAEGACQWADDLGYD